MSGFTPGPWTTNGCVVSARVGSRQCNVADVSTAAPSGGGTYKLAEHRAELASNARLIAQSPALFALAEKVARLNENAGEIGDGMLHALTIEARQLIAQVTEAQS